MAATDAFPRSKKMRAARGALAIAFIALLASPAHADRSSDTWTGAVEFRGNYYWERSTRVTAPAVRASLEGPNGLRLSADYLVDAITSASVASGLIADVRFTEVRHDVAVGAGYEVDLGDSSLDLDGRVRTSQEPDYASYSGTMSGALDFNERASTLRLSVTALHDDVGRILRGAQRIGPDGRDLSNRGMVGTMDVAFVSLGFTQILTPELTLELGYDYGYIGGFQANAYRMVPVAGVPRPENHPVARSRHAAYGRIAYFLAETQTAFHFLYRAYIDDWDIGALNPEFRIYQEIAEGITVRLRYRYYTQTRSFFARPAAEYAMNETFVTADPKMTAFENHITGVELVVPLRFLEGSALDFAYRATLDFSFDYIVNTNRFGNGVIAQGGLRIPF